MNAERYELVQRIFSEVCECPPAERQTRLEQACSGDHGLRAEVEKLLQFDDSYGSSFDATRDSSLNWAPLQPEPPLQLPYETPAYRITETLGQGGMGVVYAAKEKATGREVALKLVRPELGLARGAGRFEVEIEAHARLEHPGIARLYGAGTLDWKGHPQAYIAMEFVPGKPLLRHAAEAGLSTHQRVELLIQVIEAVQYAHQRGVLHRDLKPANILVDPQQGPKLLDLGVARLMEADSPELTRMTHSGELVGTLAYMSPEQLAGDIEIDTRSDVYSLGMVGFELLTGELPFDLRGANLIETLRRLDEQEPRSLGQLDSSLRGDLEVIFAKALARAPGKRYASASELGEDLRRYLRHEPIAARPLGTWYQLQLLARRNLALTVSLLALTMVSLVSGVVGTWLALRAQAAEREADIRAEAAELESRKFESVNEFLTDYLLSAIDPSVDGKDVRLLEVVDRAARTLESRPLPEPDVEAGIRLALGRSFTSLGQLERGEAFARRAFELHEQLHGRDSDPTRTAGLTLASNLWRSEAFEEAESLLLEIIEQADDPVLVTRAEAILGAVRLSQGSYGEAEKLLRPALQVFEEQGDTERWFECWHNLASAIKFQGRWDEAAASYDALIEAKRTVLPEDDRGLLMTRHNAAALARGQGDAAKAEQIWAEILPIQEETLGGDHPDTLLVKAGLGLLYKEAGRFEEAVPLLTDTYEAARETLGDDHTQTMLALNNLAITYDVMRDYPRAEPLLRKVLDDLARVLGEDHPHTLNAVNNLAASLQAQQRSDEALVLFQRALAAQQRVLGADALPTLISHCQLARVYAGMGSLVEARQHAETGLRGFEAQLDPEHGYVKTARAIMQAVEAAEAAATDD